MVTRSRWSQEKVKPRGLDDGLYKAGEEKSSNMDRFPE